MASPLLSRHRGGDVGEKTLEGNESVDETRGTVRLYRGYRLTYFQAIYTFIGIAIFASLSIYHHYGTSIPTFAGCAFILACVVYSTWFDFILAVRRGDPSPGDRFGRRVSTRVAFGVSTILVLWLSFLLLLPRRELGVPVLPTGEKHFIGADLYNNEAILPNWMNEMEKLIDHREATAPTSDRT